MKRAHPTLLPDGACFALLASLEDVAPNIVSSGFLPPKELFRFARSSKAVAATLVDIDLWKQLCVARLGEDAVEKLERNGFAQSFGEAGGAWERIFRGLVTRGQIKGLLGKERPRELLSAERERIPLSYISQPRESLSIPKLHCQRKDYSVVIQIVKKNDVAGSSLIASVVSGDELTEHHEGAFFEDGKKLHIKTPADSLVMDALLAQKVVIFVHLLRKTDGKACCILESFNDNHYVFNRNAVSAVQSVFYGMPVSLEEVGRKFIGHFDPEIIEEFAEEKKLFWNPFLLQKEGIHLQFRASIRGFHYDHQKSDRNDIDPTFTNSLSINLFPQVIIDLVSDDIEFLFGDFLPMECTSGAISTAHFLEQLSGWA